MKLIKNFDFMYINQCITHYIHFLAITYFCCSYYIHKILNSQIYSIPQNNNWKIQKSCITISPTNNPNLTITLLPINTSTNIIMNTNCSNWSPRKTPSNIKSAPWYQNHITNTVWVNKSKMITLTVGSWHWRKWV